MATLRRIDYDAPPYTLSFQHLPVTIGASIDNDIVLDAPQVSSHHAHVTMTRGALLLHNRSRNGTYVAGDLVEQATITENDVVAIAPFELRFKLVAAAEDSGHTAELDVPPEIAIARDAAPRRVLHTLKILKGPESVRGKQFALPKSGLRIGRSPTADLTIESPTLSRLHADIRAADDGQWEAVDLQSANGTFVNGVRIEKQVLRPGDDIVLADDVTLRFDAHDTATASPGVIHRPAAKVAGWEDPLAGSSTGKRPALRKPAVPEPQASTPPPGAAADPLASGRRPLQIKSTRASWNKRVLVIALDGWLDGYNYTELGSALDRVADNGEKCVLLDLTQLAYTDHAGLGVIMKAITAIERYGGIIRLVGASSRLRDNISLARLDGFLKGKLLADDAAARKELAGFKG